MDRHAAGLSIDRLRARVLAAAVIAALGWVAAPVRAQTDTPDPLGSAFTRMMARPGDADAALAYARLAAEQGQTRAAIIALERVLRTNPRLDNIRLELASLHLAAGSSDVAAVYAREALASPSIPPEIVDRARQLLALAEKGSARSLFAGSMFVGGRYDSNANQATALSTISVFNSGIAFAVPTPQRGRSDGSLVLNGQLTHRYDLGLQREGAWETNLSGFDQRFASIPRAYNLTLGQFDTGPRVGVADLGEGTVSVRPFFSANYLAYQSRTFAWLYGGGLSAQYQLPPRLQVELSGIGRFGKYYNSGFRPLSSDYTGAELTLALTASYLLEPGLVLGATAFYYDAGARQDYNKRRGPGAALSLAREITLRGYTFGAVVRGGIRYLSYGGPDPFIDSGRARNDTVLDLGVSATFPLFRNISAVVQYDYVRDNSGYEIYRFDDHSVTAGLRLSF